jgi:hypothetical protein
MRERDAGQRNGMDGTVTEVTVEAGNGSVLARQNQDAVPAIACSWPAAFPSGRWAGSSATTW